MKFFVTSSLTVLFLFITNGSCKGKMKEIYNILLAVPVASKSLHHLFSSLGKGLVESGHSVTLLTSFDASVFHPNLTHFQPGDFSSPLHSGRDFFKPMSFKDVIVWLKEANSEIVRRFWNNDKIVKLYQNRHQFDAIIYPSYGNDVVMPFLDDFKGVSVLFCTPGVEYNTVSRYGNWLSLAVTPVILMPYDDHMNFWERSNNLLASYVLDTFFTINFMPSFLHEMRVHFPDFENPIRYYEKSSVTLINGHFALNGPVPLLPNQIEVGTINARKPRPLPKDLEEFIDGSGEAGVIYFSLGSFVMGKEIPMHIKEILLEAFRLLSQRVIWKYEEMDLQLPPNVLKRKWLPQQDILGHPKTKIFMSHCGNLGTQEAKYHGVPVLAVPIAFDQPRNAAQLVRKGYAVMLEWDEMTVDKLLEAVHTLTKDSTYYDRLKAVSRILQDQKESPAERAVWWVEYVIRHKGAPHLRYAGQRLHFLQYIMVDVLAFWGLVLALFSFLFIMGCKAIWRHCQDSTKDKRD